MAPSLPQVEEAALQLEALLEAYRSIEQASLAFAASFDRFREDPGERTEADLRNMRQDGEVHYRYPACNASPLPAGFVRQRLGSSLGQNEISAWYR